MLRLPNHPNVRFLDDTSLLISTRAALSMLLAKPRSAERKLVACGAPAELWTPQPVGGGAEWEGGPMQDGLSVGWAASRVYSAKPAGLPLTAELAPFRLGAEAQAMLTDGAYVGRVLHHSMAISEKIAQLNAAWPGLVAKHEARVHEEIADRELFRRRYEALVYGAPS